MKRRNSNKFAVPNTTAVALITKKLHLLRKQRQNPLLLLKLPLQQKLPFQKSRKQNLLPRKSLMSRKMTLAQ